MVVSFLAAPHGHLGGRTFRALTLARIVAEWLRTLRTLRTLNMALVHVA